MSPHYCATFIFTPVRSFILDLQLCVHLWCNPGWTTPTPLRMECQHPTCTNYSWPQILSLVWFGLDITIFQQIGFQFVGASFTNWRWLSRSVCVDWHLVISLLTVPVTSLVSRRHLRST